MFLALAACAASASYFCDRARVSDPGADLIVRGASSRTSRNSPRPRGRAARPFDAEILHPVFEAGHQDCGIAEW